MKRPREDDWVALIMKEQKIETNFIIAENNNISKYDDLYNQWNGCAKTVIVNWIIIKLMINRQCSVLRRP